MKHQTLFVEGFEQAIIGVDTSIENEVPRIVYSKSKMIDVIVSSGEMLPEDAAEFLEYNVFNSHLGKGTPIYVDDADHESAVDIIEEYG